MNSQGDAVYAGICRVDRVIKDNGDQGTATMGYSGHLVKLAPDKHLAKT